MFSLEEFEEKLFDISEEIPDEYYANLSGGIIVSPECKIHPKSHGDELCIMGEYCIRSESWRYIILYYGSFAKQYAASSDDFWEKRMREVLQHELKHHWESQAGLRGLEIQDKIDIAKYLDRKKKQQEKK